MSKFGNDGQQLVNVKVERETHALLLKLKGRMLATGKWTEEPTHDQVLNAALRAALTVTK